MSERDRLLRRLDRNLSAAMDPSLPGPERKRRARAAAHWGEKLGLLKRPAACESCGKADAYLEKHHSNHSVPLFVVWVCADCHARLDSRTEHLDRDDGKAA